MDSTSQKWLIGCGTGCAALVIVIVLLVGGAVVFVRDKIRPLQEASDSRKEIVAALGAVETFVPAPDGAIDRERMEKFLAVRDSLRNAQDHLDGALANVDFDRLKQRRQSFGEVLRTLNELSSLIAPIGEYMDRRNRALLDKHMGLGEYAYIYSISYHSWLGHLPEEGPPFLARLRQRNREHPGASGDFTPEAIRGQYRRLITRMLENQLQGLGGSELKDWRVKVKQEIDRLDRSLDRVAWQDNLPAPIEESLKPYRSRLEATYRQTTNCFELLTLEESRRIEWSTPETKVGIGSERGSDSGPAEALPEVAATGPGNAGAGAGGTTAGCNVSYRVGDGVTAPVLITRPTPDYTDEARKARIAGVVAIQAVVRKNGSLGSAKVIRKLGYGLDEAALNTITRNWKFKPGMLNGAPVDVQTDIEIVFRAR